MKKTFWDSIEYTYSFSLSNFDKDAFLKDIDEKNKNRRVHRMFFSSSEQPGKQHSHIDVQFLPKEWGDFKIIFHHVNYELPPEKQVEKPPYMEDCVQWIGQFFKNDDVILNLSAYFEFDSNFSPVIALPFPLITDNKNLAGSLITGLNIQLVGQRKIKSVIIQPDNDILYITGRGRTRVKLRTFNFSEELETITDVIRLVVKEKEN